MSQIIYYDLNIDNKNKLITFLEKNNFTVLQVNTSVDVIRNITGTCLIITTSEDLLYLISNLTQKVPVIVLTKPNEKLKLVKTNNIVFYRSYADPLLTILETIKFLIK